MDVGQTKERRSDNPVRPPSDRIVRPATELYDRLLARQVGGYHASDAPATEPTALAALALLAREEANVEQAAEALAYLKRAQAQDGSVGVRMNEPEPAWTTSLAVLAWEQAARLASDRAQFDARIEPAVAWILSQRGKTSLPDPDIGHDPQLIAWSWAAETHSWIEPTALHVLALKAVGEGSHARAREAVRMLIDRQLPSGGCNYGNTFVLGQMLRPHLEPSGLLALALAGESDPSGRLERTLDYLARSLSAATPPISLAWSLLGLAAHDRLPDQAGEWVAAAYDRVCAKDESPYKFALLAHAALGANSPLIRLPQGAKP
jgi:hypothetical protein